MITLRPVLAAQGVYYAVTGLWPLFHMPSFILLTGPKVELWLVEMVGLLAFAVGLALLLAAWRQAVHTETVVLALATAAAFCYIDVRYFLAGWLSAVYLADAAVQIVLIAAVCVTGWSQRRRHE